MKKTLEQQFDFDQYGRYASVRRIVEMNRKNNQSFRILDVGGRGNHLQQFLPNDEVFYLDPLVDQNEDANYIPGDGCEMPLEDNSFDFVVSLDTFEHIPKDQRDNFVREHIRVARLMAIIIAPFTSPGVAQAEKQANIFFESLTGEEHPWLTEHIAYGLPELDQVTNIANTAEVPMYVSGNNSLSVWSLIAPLNFFITTVGEKIRPALEEWNQWYNTTIFPIDSDPNSYRKIIILQKSLQANVPENSPTPLKNEHAIAITEHYLQLVTAFYAITKNEHAAVVNSAQEVGAEYTKTLNLYKDAITKLQSVTHEFETFRTKHEIAISEYDSTLTYLHSTIAHVEKLEREKQIMEASIFWKLRTVSLILVSPKKMKRIGKKALSLAKKARHIQKQRGIGTLLKLAKMALTGGMSAVRPSGIHASEYTQWIQENEQYDLKAVAAEIEALTLKPTISIVTPVYNVDPKWLNACIQSVVDQSYPYWQLCLHDDASTNPETIKALKKWEGVDDRIVISYGNENQHICGASNSALEHATGDFVSLLDCDDALAPFALYEFAKAINAHPESDFFYSDEDKIDTSNKRLNPFFRPDWSPHLLRSVNYITHMVAIRKTAGDAIHWFRNGYEGAQDFDLFLRLSNYTEQPIIHIPKILYHWRMLESSTAADTSVKTYAHDNGEKALQEHLDALGVQYESISAGIGMTNYRIRYTIPKDTLVSIIIPFKDKPELLRDCVESLLQKTTYQNFELLLVDNNSVESSTQQLLAKLQKTDSRIRVLEYKKPFNYSALNNWAAKHATGSVLCLLNNDTKIISPEWLEEMIGLAIQPEVGSVGAKLLFEDGTIQHAGVVLGMTGLAGHVFSGEQPESTYYRMADFTANYLAVTAACLVIETKKYWEVGGLNEEFTVCGNDVNLGLELYERGYYNVYCPNAVLYHYESKTRDKTPPAGDFEISKKRYAPYLNFRDPFYNSNLSLRNEQVHLRSADEKPLIDSE